MFQEFQAMPRASVDEVPAILPASAPTRRIDWLRALGRLSIGVVHEAVAEASFTVSGPWRSPPGRRQ